LRIYVRKRQISEEKEMKNNPLLKTGILTALVFVINSVVFADNPLVRHIFTADPAPIVYNDTFYIFTGRDEGRNNGWIMNGWHVLSSTDMANWTDHGVVLAVKDVTWLNQSQAWAAQCIERDGKFYFYICDSGEIGVAVADNILGPYTDALGKPLISNKTPGACPGDDNIDPSVFIDDDGQAYIYWGTDNVARQAKLKRNMIEIDGEITVPQGINRFFEASWVHKRNGIYYYSYAARNSSGNNWPSNIDYCTSTNPLGPWTYKGTINDFAGTGTNHSGIIEYKDKWYFVYHTDYLSGGTAWQRSVQVDNLFYNNDGTIRKIVQTEEGPEPVGKPPFEENVYYKIRAKHSGKLVDVEGASTSIANVFQASDNGHKSQHWKLVRIGNGVYKFVNRNSGLVLDADMSSNNVLQYTNNDGNNQKWKLTGNGRGEYYIVNVHYNRMLEVYYAETNDGANVQHWEFNGETCQQWKLEKVDTGAVEITFIRDNTPVRSGILPGGNVCFSYGNSRLSPSGSVFDLSGRIRNVLNPNRQGSGFVINREASSPGRK
jgi:hypothetical protein